MKLITLHKCSILSWIILAFFLGGCSALRDALNPGTSSAATSPVATLTVLQRKVATGVKLEYPITESNKNLHFFWRFHNSRKSPTEVNSDSFESEKNEKFNMLNDRGRWIIVPDNLVASIDFIDLFISTDNAPIVKLANQDYPSGQIFYFYDLHSNLTHRVVFPGSSEEKNWARPYLDLYQWQVLPPRFPFVEESDSFLNLKWGLPLPGAEGYIIAKSQNTISWNLAEGAIYTVGDEPVSGTKIAYARYQGSDDPHFTDTETVIGTKYYYKIFSFRHVEGLLKYSDGIEISYTRRSP